MVARAYTFPWSGEANRVWVEAFLAVFCGHWNMIGVMDPKATRAFILGDIWFSHTRVLQLSLCKKNHQEINCRKLCAKTNIKPYYFPQH